MGQIWSQNTWLVRHDLQSLRLGKEWHEVAGIGMIWIVAIPVLIFPTGFLKPGFSL
jgi:hypothetical protein